jgi:hypothetical protein
VYYADSTGTVHRLLPNGSNSVVADFPLSGHQLLSYAVSPDGGRLIAIVLTVPPLHNPPPQDLTQPYFQEGAHWSLAVETASAGGSTQTTFTKDFGTNYPQPTLVAGWDSSGPVATTASCIGAQNPPQSVRMCGSLLIHIAPDGSHVDQIGGSDCLPLDELPDGTMLCATRVGTEVRRPSGETLWRVAWPDQNYYWGVSLSPDGNAVAAQDVVVSRSGVASAPRTRSPGNPSLVAEGWVDSSTVVEAGPNGQLELCPARDLARCQSLGLSGIYEGVLQSRGR